MRISASEDKRLIPDAGAEFAWGAVSYGALGLRMATQILQTLRDRPVVVFGSGNLGQRIGRSLTKAGIQIRAFADQ